MNKTELIAAIAAKAELSKKDAEKALAAMTDTVVEQLAKGEKVPGSSALAPLNPESALPERASIP